MPNNIRKSVSWNFLIIWASLLLAWFIRDTSHHYYWFLLGVTIGVIIEIIEIGVRRNNKKRSNLIACFLFIVVAVLGILSVFEPILLGIAAGMLLPMTLALILKQIYLRKVISWKDIANGND